MFLLRTSLITLFIATTTAAVQASPIDNEVNILEKRNDYCKNNRGREGSYTLYLAPGVTAFDTGGSKQGEGYFKITEVCNTDFLPVNIIRFESDVEKYQCKFIGLPQDSTGFVFQAHRLGYIPQQCPDMAIFCDFI